MICLNYTANSLKARNRGMIFKQGDYVLFNDKRSKISIKENDSYIELINAKRMHVIHYLLDKGIIPENDSSVQKCDSIVECIDNEVDRIIYAIELKGGDVNHALEQLASTMKLLFELDYRSRNKHFMKACNTEDFSKLKGEVIRLRVVSSKPGKSKIRKQSATHSIKYTKETMLRQVCQRHHINYNIDNIIIKSGSSENI